MEWFKRRRKKAAEPVVIDSEAFVADAIAYKKDLVAAKDFTSLSKLWKQKNIPYRMRVEDPLSDAYRAEVLDVYQRLVGGKYDTVNEMTSTHLTPENFARGFPWVSGDLGVVASELGKVVQVFSALGRYTPEAKSVIEFGVGWGNSAVPMARAGLDVCAVDIDEAFLKRTAGEAKALSTNVRTMHAEFLEAARDPGQRYDVALFSSSFHHCLEFEELLRAIKENVLTENGCIMFFAEPISNGMSFPWGLRYDGEAIWAITCNKWLELGFSEDFFRELMARVGFSVEPIPDPSGLSGPGWLARSL